MRNTLMVVIASFVLGGCLGPIEPAMSNVMASCEGRSNFTAYMNCIKSNYKRFPNQSPTLSMYARLDSINEDYENGAISELKARAAARIAYDETWGKENSSRSSNAAASYRAPISCTTYGNTTNCY